MQLQPPKVLVRRRVTVSAATAGGTGAVGGNLKKETLHLIALLNVIFSDLR